MTENQNQPKEYDAVLGGQLPPPIHGLVLGGIEGVKKRLVSISFEQRIAALEDALNYGEAGLELLIQTLTDVSPEVQQTAENLLFQHRTEPRVKQALHEYDPWLLFECLQTIIGHTDDVDSVIINPDGQTIFSCSSGKTIRLWSLSQRQEISTLQGHSRGINSIAIHPNGQILASGSYDETIKLWDVETRQELRTLTAHSGGVHAIAISPDSRTLISGGADNTVKVWDFQTGNLLRTLNGHSEAVYAVTFHPDGQTIVSKSDDKTLKLWCFDTGKELYTLPTGSSGGRTSLAFSPDGQILVSACRETLKLWDWSNKQELHVLRGYLDYIQYLTFSSGGINSFAISPYGQLLACNIINQRMILVCDLQVKEQLNTLKEPHHSAYSHCLALIPNKQILVDANLHLLDLWNLDTGRLTRTLTAHSQNFKSIAISSDGETLVTGDKNSIIKVWVLPTREEKLTINAQSGSILCVAISPDGQNLISGCEDGTMKVWDLQTGRRKAIFNGHTDGVYFVAISADGQTLISGSVDGTIKIWGMP
ncbi:WD40 repeat domain-containing protein [Nostoc sp. NMS4]|uniref:WD40 repeat domain-containing protein n=1 Tax=Nostoc sp. NMS4 TaxID=2815390 RepID=UPI0025FB0FE9|nr:WD40 repeat domain-containing protein [Nostoc sp. NMS4]MBN3922329.1 WD40 repeat domain-containing protein [Nostoc sp. NMS4]